MSTGHEIRKLVSTHSVHEAHINRKGSYSHGQAGFIFNHCLSDDNEIVQYWALEDRKRRDTHGCSWWVR